MGLKIKTKPIPCTSLDQLWTCDIAEVKEELEPDFSSVFQKNLSPSSLSHPTQIWTNNTDIYRYG